MFVFAMPKIEKVHICLALACLKMKGIFCLGETELNQVRASVGESTVQRQVLFSVNASSGIMLNRKYINNKL